MSVSKILVKCIRSFINRDLIVGQIYEATLLPEPGISQMTLGYHIEGCRYSVYGFKEASAIEKLHYYNRRRRERKKSDV
jgi:hypothetical protein